MSTLTATAISLIGECQDASCAEFAAPLHRQLESGYERCSLLGVPGSLAEWREGHRTARKRADRAFRLGYHFEEIKRERYEAAVHEINTSLGVRQHRPMSADYLERPHFSPLPAASCPVHGVRTFGVLDARDSLVAYLWLYRSGELALVSSILGHGDHLEGGIMYLLFEGVVGALAGEDGWFVYNRHDSGTDGLRFYKERLGFEPCEVEWRL